METRLLSGKPTAEALKLEVAAGAAELKADGVVPGLAAVLVGDDPASKIYVRNKVKTCLDLGMHSELVRLPAETTQEELIDQVRRLNDDDTIDGVLLQLPLPRHIDEEAILPVIRPEKDVDGFHPMNLGRLFRGEHALVSCTPAGIMALLRHEDIPLEGAEAVVVGRSNIVGKPMALLLQQKNATVTMCHSRTRDLARVCRRADLIVAAVGSPALITRDFIKPGAVIVDVGMNRLTDRDDVVRLFGADSPRLEVLERRGQTLVGDVHPRDPIGLASAVTPVPGGVGLLTIAQLMKNTLLACRARRTPVAASQES